MVTKKPKQKHLGVRVFSRSLYGRGGALGARVSRRTLQLMGDEIAQAPALSVRPLLQPLGEPPGQGGADPGWLASEPIRTMRQLGRRCGQRAAALAGRVDRTAPAYQW